MHLPSLLTSAVPWCLATWKDFVIVICTCRLACLIVRLIALTSTPLFFSVPSTPTFSSDSPYLNPLSTVSRVGLTMKMPTAAMTPTADGEPDNPASYVPEEIAQKVHGAPRRLSSDPWPRTPRS